MRRARPYSGNTDCIHTFTEVHGYLTFEVIQNPGKYNVERVGDDVRQGNALGTTRRHVPV